jgi:hypothetical protein
VESIAIPLGQMIACEEDMLSFCHPIIEGEIRVIKFGGERRVGAPFYAMGLVIEHGLP